MHLDQSLLRRKDNQHPLPMYGHVISLHAHTWEADPKGSTNRTVYRNHVHSLNLARAASSADADLCGSRCLRCRRCRCCPALLCCRVSSPASLPDRPQIAASATYRVDQNLFSLNSRHHKQSENVNTNQRSRFCSDCTAALFNKSTFVLPWYNLGITF